MQQLLANILFSACSIFLVAISFSVIFSTARFFHFTHAAIITIAAYLGFAFTSVLRMPLLFSVIFAMVVVAGLGWCLDKVVYRPMRRKGSSPLVLLLASLGMYIVLQNLISVFFGDDTKLIGNSTVTPGISILKAKLTYIQLVVICAGVLVFLAKVFLIDKTKIGLSLKAVADDPELAKISGIDFENVMGIAFGSGSFLAGASGLFRALDVGMTPTMGLPMLLMGVVAVILGGNGKTLGVVIASLLLATCQQVAGWKLGTHWEEAVAFLLLLAFLLYRPQGILGKPIRKATA